MVGFRISMTAATRVLCNVPVAIVFMLAGFACATEPEPAQTQRVPVAAQQAAPTTPSRIAKKADAKPAWNELTPAQQLSLAPLAAEWNKMPARNKEKWLAIGNKFAAMGPEEQVRMQNRMRDWAKLTPAQRRSVRESYTRAKKLDADKKTAQWKKYQQLSEEQKKKLAQAKLPKHVSALPATRRKAAPVIQLPPEALEQTLSPPTLVLPAAAVPTEAK